MIELKQHRKIAALVSDWLKLVDLYSLVCKPGMVTVQIMGTHHPELAPGAVDAAKKMLKAQGQRIVADLKQLNFNTTGLPSLEPLSERVNEPAKSD